jgi:hypothetical protein
MKKSLVAMMILLAATSAFAAGVQKASPNATFAFGVGGAAAGPSTTNNDDSCDIGVAPAATLLLPYFEVDFNAPATTARTTLFTVTNTSPYPQIAHVTVWTDWSFPALDFNIFLTGYDVQAINLYDVLARGIIGTLAGTSIDDESAEDAQDRNPAFASPFDNDANPNFLGSAATLCATGRLPGQIPEFLLRDLRSILTTGRTATGLGISCPSAAGTQQQVGSNHGANALGYITIDVAATCSINLPTSPAYFTTEILFDNVLIGDYQDVNPNATTGNFAGGNPMVHIRAIPEGGPAGTIPAGVTNLPYTFYDRYTVGAPDRRVDRRQPLPSVFGARYIQGGTSSFDTRYKIWREGITGANAACTAYAANSNLAITEIVRFDEHENANVVGGGLVISPLPPGAPGLPETSQTPSTAAQFPALSSPAGDVAGWMYMNLNNGGATTYSAARPGFAGAGTSTTTNRQSQNWVIVSMFAEGRYSVDFDAAWMGNGCSVAPPPASQVGPTGNNTGGVYQRGTLVCPAGAATCTPNSLTYPGTNVTP